MVDAIQFGINQIYGLNLMKGLAMSDKTKAQDDLMALADKFEMSGFGGHHPAITAEDLIILGIDKIPKTAKSAFVRYGKYKLDNWEDFCAWVYEKVTGLQHPGSKCTGSGARSQHFAKITADAIRDKCRDILLDFREDEFKHCVILYVNDLGLEEVTDYLNGSRCPDGVHKVNGSIDYNYGVCINCGMKLHTGRRFKGTIFCPACGKEIEVT